MTSFIDEYKSFVKKMGGQSSISSDVEELFDAVSAADENFFDTRILKAKEEVFKKIYQIGVDLLESLKQYENYKEFPELYKEATESVKHSYKVRLENAIFSYNQMLEIYRKSK